MSLKQTLLDENKELKARVDALETRLREIGDIAHDESAGPAVHDRYWDIRELAYELL